LKLVSEYLLDVSWSPAVKLTAANIRALKLPPGVADKVFFDEDVPGFGLRMRASGVHSWMINTPSPGARAGSCSGS
jgi:hypothetical protein